MQRPDSLIDDTKLAAIDVSMLGLVAAGTFFDVFKLSVRRVDVANETHTLSTEIAEISPVFAIGGQWVFREVNNGSIMLVENVTYDLVAEAEGAYHFTSDYTTLPVFDESVTVEGIVECSGGPGCTPKLLMTTGASLPIALLDLCYNQVCWPSV